MKMKYVLVCLQAACLLFQFNNTVMASNAGNSRVPVGNTPQPPPANNKCQDATGPLPVDGRITDGDSKGATVDFELPWWPGRVGYGVWYTVIGTGHTMVASLGGVEFSVGIFMGGFWVTVFEGDCDDDLFSKVGHEYTVSRSRHSSAWSSTLGQSYYLYVYTHDPLYLQTFHLAVTSLEDTVTLEGYSEQTAMEIQADGSIQKGSLYHFTSPPISDDFGEFRIGGSAAWYKVQGDGGLFLMNRTKNASENVGTQLLHIVNDTQYVVQGDFLKDRGFIWQTQIGEWYHFEITRTKKGGMDNYGFSVAKVTDGSLPANALCQNALELEVNSPPTTGTTINATKLSLVGRPDPSRCFYMRRGGLYPGLWYKVWATGKHLKVSIKSTEEDPMKYTTKYDIFTAGDDACSVLNCTGAMMEAGRLNYILVKSVPSGRFNISIQQLEPPSNNHCEDAEPLKNVTRAEPVAEVPGSLDYALPYSYTYQDTVAEVSSNEVLGVWYQFFGNGETVQTFLCQERYHWWALSKGGLSMKVFAVKDGGCDGLVCVAGCGNETQHSLTFDAKEGTEFKILVYSDLPASTYPRRDFRLWLAPSTLSLPRGTEVHKYYSTCGVDTLPYHPMAILPLFIAFILALGACISARGRQKAGQETVGNTNIIYEPVSAGPEIQLTEFYPDEIPEEQEILVDSS